MSEIKPALRGFFFAPQSSAWLGVLRVGLGLQVLFYAISLRSDWLEILGLGNQGLIRRDLAEAMLSADSRFIPRVGWIVDGGVQLGISENTMLWLVWATLVMSASLLVIGLFCREASVLTWFLYVCTAKSGEVLSYGVDNFTIIGLFYLAIAPFPDAWSVDARMRGVVARNPSLQRLHRRVLQLHICAIYFFGGIAKCAGRGWWDGTSLWRAMTRAPFNVVPGDILIHGAFLLPIIGILVCVMEATYPIFIWPQKTRLIWFVGVVGMHAAIGLLMGMYLFASVMIILNLSAFGPESVVRLRRSAESFSAQPPLVRTKQS